MILSIHQPSYWPWLGLLHKISKSDKLIFLDNVDMKRQSNQFRNQFYCNGEAKFISLPVEFHQNTKICDIKFKNNNWIVEHLNKLSNYYKKAPFYNSIFPLVEELYIKSKDLAPYLLVIETTLFLMKHLNILTETELASKNKYQSKKGELMFEICSINKASHYLSGQGSKNYMGEEILNKFANQNIKIIWHEFKHPVYNQNSKYPFLSGLSGLDILFFEGFENSKLIFNNID